MTNEYERATKNAAEAASSQVADAFEKGTATAEETRDAGRNQGTDVRDQAAEAGDQAAGIAGEAKEKAQETADKAMDVSAKKMEKSADTIREKVGGEGGMKEKAGMAVADKMEQSANYLRDHDSEQLMADVEKYIKEHPMQAVVGAVAFGLVVGRILR